MRVLLDTHVWIWSLVEPERLSERVRDVIEDASTALHVSAASWWEIALLAERGRLAVDGDLDAWFAYATREYPVTIEPITADIALRSRRLALPHQDPADRFIAATAVCLDLSLATRDAQLRAAEGVPTLDW